MTMQIADTSTDTQTPLNDGGSHHGRATNSAPARFLEDVGQGEAPSPADTPLDELGDYYDEWRRRRGLDTEQAEIGGWSR